MKFSKITLLPMLLIILTGCNVDYDMPYDNALKSTVGETVEVVSSNAQDTVAFANAEGTQAIADIPSFSKFERATVVNIVDGDTVDIKYEGEGSADNTRIRLILINTPESKGEYENNAQPYANEAADFTEMLLLNNDVWVEYDVERTDRYGRTLAYLWLAEADYEYKGVKYHEKEVMINDLLLKFGLAHVAVYKPNVLYKDRFYAIENEAKQNRIGMWE